MFKRLFCKHKYKYFNTKVVYPFASSWGYNAFQFVCPKCGKVVEVTETEIDDMYSKYKSKYNKNLALGEPPINSSGLTIPRHYGCGIRYESPATTLMLEEYSNRGIDLTEINRTMRF